METSFVFIGTSATWHARHTACNSLNLFLGWNVQSPEGTSSSSYIGLIHGPISSCSRHSNRFPKFSSSKRTRPMPLVLLSTSLQRMFRQNPQRQRKRSCAGKGTGGQQRLRVSMGPDSALSRLKRGRCMSHLRRMGRNGECWADQFGHCSWWPWKGPDSSSRGWGQHWSDWKGVGWESLNEIRDWSSMTSHFGQIHLKMWAENITANYFFWIANLLSHRINTISQNASR